MDALRRAEADESPTTANAEAEAVAADTGAEASAQPAPDNNSLQLEPMEAAASSDHRLTEAADHNVANDTSATTNNPAAVDGDKSEQADARRAIDSMNRKRSPVKKQAIYVFTGFATAGFILAAYYLWKSDQLTGQHARHSATLVTAPDTPAVEDVSKTVDAVFVEPAKPQVAATPDKSASTTYPPPSGENTVDQSTATISSAAGATTDSTAYKIEIHKRSVTRDVPKQLKQAYQAYQDKNYQQAKDLYRQALRRYPGNQNAMFGLAAIALHQGERRVAHYYYTQILKADPGNKNALLAVQALNGKQYQLENGSQIKHWLQSGSDSAPLYFALGNQHAANSRWKEAQQAYFDAYRLESGNADFAFNLAVSLDQLGLRTEALDYYLTAQNLSAGGGAQFSSSALERRIKQLRIQTGQDS